MRRASLEAPTYLVLPILLAGLHLVVSPLHAQEADRSERERMILERVEERDPEVRVDGVDRERLTVRRIDVVDEDGVIRMTIAGVLPDPVVDGVQYERDIEVSGLMVRDDEGNERGGFVYAPARGGPLLALDHPTAEGAGFALREDGTALSFLGAAPEPARSEVLDGARLPGGTGHPASNIVTRIGPDGRPSLVLTDDEGRGRVRVTVTEEGYGAIEFVDADGEVVESFVPERDREE